MTFPFRWTPGPHFKGQKVEAPKRSKPIRRKPRSREERDRITAVRAKCVTRDGYCRGQREGYVHTCEGPSEWAHLERKRRSKTRNQPPAIRHTTADSLMLCQSLHRLYDKHQVAIEVGGRGCNGPLRIARLP